MHKYKTVPDQPEFQLLVREPPQLLEGDLAACVCISNKAGVCRVYQIDVCTDCLQCGTVCNRYMGCVLRDTHNDTRRYTAYRDRGVLQGSPEDILLRDLVAPCLGDWVRRSKCVDRCDVCVCLDVIYAIQHMWMYMWTWMYRTHIDSASIHVNGVYCFLLVGFRNRWRNKPVVHSWLQRYNKLQCG